MIVTAAVLENLQNASPYAQSRPVRLVEIEQQAPGPGEVLIRMEAAGLCHSDLSRVDGNRVGVVPVVLGHEGCGRVVARGEGVEDLEIGQKVTTLFHGRCGRCETCRAGQWSLCPEGLRTAAEGSLLGGVRRMRQGGVDLHHHAGVSAFADHAVVNRQSVVPIPDAIPSDVGALLGCAILTGGGAVRNAGRVRPGDEVAVVGLGGVGLAAAMVAAGYGARVTGIDPSPRVQAMARAVGVAAVRTPDEVVDSGASYDLVVEAVGRPEALTAAIGLTNPGGRTVTVGLPHPSATITLSPAMLVLEARSLIGSYFGSGDPSQDIAEYAEMYLSGKLPIDELISEHIRLDQINDALDVLAAGGAARQVIVFD
ncbi:alcohol dehydrogenase catalytic domain-containing protein [Microbacterium sp. RD1]|uniref:alcohol dehydrogenase catalytic domain-containing protein n=1 Tax=Microbacterium sp. RD1 TaxID=3457313 RepID=UPI003FA54A7A